MQRFSLGQIFYGRGSDGYGVLGVSPAGRPFLGTVASLCRAVGSPDRPGEIPTFLLGKREDDAAIMIRACRGAADPTGRATILFHALVADAASLRSAGLDAFAFADNGTFAATCSTREPPDLVFPDVQAPLSGQPAARTLDLPATVSSDYPLDSLVRRELGGESLDKNWATFSFNPLPGFDLCVLSSYSPRKGEGTHYAFDGAGVHRLSSKAASGKNGGGTAAQASHGSPRKSPSVLLLVSLVANAIFALALLLHGGHPKANQSEGASVVAEMTESDARAKWEAQWKSEWEKSLPAPTSDIAESEARAKWEEQWKSEWEESLRKEFKRAIQNSGGEWPILFDNDNSPFGSSIRSAQTEPDDARASARWKLYRSCKACADFIQIHLNP